MKIFSVKKRGFTESNIMYEAEIYLTMYNSCKDDDDDSNQ